MSEIVIPVFGVIFAGFLFGRFHPSGRLCDKLINDYVFYISLPALLFVSMVKADTTQLHQWGFLSATLLGIAVTYVLGILLACKNKIPLPEASIIGMAACYGTAGYLGIPVLISAFGERAIVPAAIATVMHNIPAVMAVTITHDIYHSRTRIGRASPMVSMMKVLVASLRSPVILAVLAGLVFLAFSIKVPKSLDSFSTFLGAAAGPTALFALGLNLSRFKVAQVNRESLYTSFKTIGPLIFFKLVLHPIVTFFIAFFIFHMPGDSLWLVAAVVMAAQPIGAGVSIFAGKYRAQQETVSLAVVISILVAVVTLPILLNFLPISSLSL